MVSNCVNNIFRAIFVLSEAAWSLGWPHLECYWFKVFNTHLWLPSKLRWKFYFVTKVVDFGLDPERSCSTVGELGMATLGWELLTCA